MKIFFSFLVVLALATGGTAQTSTILSKLQPDKEYENVFSKAVSSDSLSSSFVIWIKKEVKPHYHATHSENIIVISGAGHMQVGEKEFDVAEGMHVFIPKGTTHSVKKTSAEPLKVLSVQSPYFDGKDRIMVEK